MRSAGAGLKPLVSTAVLLLPAAILIAPHLGEASYLLLAVLGLYYFLKNGVPREIGEKILLLSLLTLGFYLVTFVSALASTSVSTSLWNPGHLREFLAAPLLGILLLATHSSARLLMLSVKLAAIVIFGVALYQFLSGLDRPGGAVNPLVFARLALLLGFFSIIRFPLESLPEKFFSLVAFSSGCMAAVLAQSRSAWILSIILFAYLLFAWRRTGCLTRRVAVGVTSLFLALALVASQAPAVQQRIASAWNNYQAYSENGTWNNSLGIRIMLWQSAVSAARQKPLGGWGVEQTQVAAAAQLDSADKKKVILGYNHLHNEYLNNLVGKGLAGLASVLLLLFLPLAIFLKQSGDRERLAYNGIGAMLCIGYAVSGLANQAFGDDTMNIFFVFFLSATLPASGLVRFRTTRYPYSIDRPG